MTEEKIYLKPATVEKAVRFAFENENDFQYLAGGTDLVVNKFNGTSRFSCLIDITGIAGLKEVNVKGGHLSIGALVKLDELKNHEIIQRDFSSLLSAVRAVASPVIRKSATLGGNLLVENRCIFYNQGEWWRKAARYCLKCDGDICIATGGKKNCFSKFVSDTAVALISMDACVEVAEYHGGYMAHLEDIYSGDGVQPLKFKRGSLICAVLLPLQKGFRSVFKKLRQRESLDFASLSTAVTVNTLGKIKIVLGGVGPRPVVVEGALKDGRNELIMLAVKKARIVDNDVYTRSYRKEMIRVFLERSFKELQI